MTDLVMWTLIVGFVLPPVVAVLQQPKFSKPARASITAVVSVLGGLGTAYFNDQFHARPIVSSILLVGVSAITFYRGFFKPTGIAPAIEGATSSKA